MSSRSKAWLCCAVAATVFIAYLPFFKALARVSVENPYAGHVIFVPILAAVLLWLDRHRLRGLTGHGRVGGAGLTAVALALAGIAYRVSSVPLQALSLVLTLAGLGLWMCGMRGVRRMGFVLVFLLFMMPPPRDAVATLAPGVQHLVAAFSAVVLDGLRIPVELEGVSLRLPGLTLEVAEECAGLRFLLTLLVLVSAFARMVLPTISAQLALVVLSIPVAVLTNAARVAATSVGAYAIGPDVATGPLHFYIGKGFWALGLLAMIGFALWLRSRTHGAVAAGRSRPGACVLGAP